ncbi:F-box/kelch-repeat protein [Trifolium pratense]|uniref:F-box/kelch-repeat protein n=1 Tax=Trifolium pratense TaxID=57577 RepID=A0A2K3JZA3_TRIPR|nr:F-box/kelch-repeat protein [Trifolium pratense]
MEKKKKMNSRRRRDMEEEETQYLPHELIITQILPRLPVKSLIRFKCMALLKYNDKGQLLEHESYCEDPLGAQVTVYTESLLSLPGPGDNVQA